MFIDLDDNPFFSFFTFPGGEIGIRNTEHWVSPCQIYLIARLNNTQKLMELLAITDSLKRQGCELSLVCPYFPGARQDRVANDGDPLTVKIYADIINSQNYKEVVILDPHSDVTTALVNNVRVQSVSSVLKSIVEKNKIDTIIIPDAGASKKTFSYYFTENIENLKFVQCLKKRNTETGKLSGFKVVDDIDENANCLICDDICDGGGTFIGLYEEIMQKQPTAKVSLYVTHGIFSNPKNLEVMKLNFENIFTVNSFDETKIPNYTELY